MIGNAAIRTLPSSRFEQALTQFPHLHSVRVLELTDEFLSQAIGNSAIRARELLQLTRTQAADILSISANHLGRIENGLTLPGFLLFVRMIDEYGVSADGLLGWHPAVREEQRPRDVVELDQLPTVVGIAVRTKREDLGVPRRCLAERIGITARFLLSIEDGERLPNVLAFARLVEELNLVADDVLTVADEQES